MQTVVLVHGLWMPGSELLLLERRLGSAGFETRRVPFRSVRDTPEESVQRLTIYLDSVPGDVVHLIGHSLGGLLAVEAALRLPVTRRGRVVCLGTPLTGSHSARRLSELGGRRLLGASSEALLDGITSRVPDDLEVGVIAGRLRLGLGMLLGRLPRPHDGVVAVEETHLEGVAAHRVMPVNHYSLLWSRSVSDQVIQFLRTGRFSRPKGP